MEFGEKLTGLRRSRGLSQDELGQELGVSRQTISKWELSQSYPDFQRLVLLSDYFELSLDSLVKDIDVEDMREQNHQDRQLAKLYHDAETVRSTVNLILNAFAIIGVIGVLLFLILGCLG
ncbi:MAG: helix-turn-helix transcriptional regulator [Clostridiales bacterium]|nr:helix-turn-helix transcriptional regulator [Clostridiales bacterium]